MQVWIYNIALQSYFAIINIAACFGSRKAKDWVAGRKGYWQTLSAVMANKRQEGQPLVWMHCASLGEFEQGRPVIEALKQEDPRLFLLLTFFSPSGYLVRKDYPMADHVAYLPSDSAKHAKSFLRIVNPSLAIFVKYEFWWHFLFQLKQQGVRTVLISAIFRQGQPFFKWYGSLHRKMLACFQLIFVQDEASKFLLEQVGFIDNVVLAGDNRVDRVLAIAKRPMDLPLVAQFCGNSPILVCGSTWAPDENLLRVLFSNKAFQQWKFILAPHDVLPERLLEIESSLEIPTVRYSHYEKSAKGNESILLIDNIGMLSSLYNFGTIAYIGGGFGQGIHNTLEPAAHGLPILFGPKHKKFEEAKWFVKHGGGFVVRDTAEILKVFTKLQEERTRATAAQTVAKFIEARSGATKLVMERIRRLLPA